MQSLQLSLQPVFCVIYKLTVLIFLSLFFPMRTALAAESYSPYAGHNHPLDVYWGDTHLHTNMSMDAYGLGNSLLTPDDAYRFAKGEFVIAHNGMQARLSRPLDFLVVADHAENIGVLLRLEAGDVSLLKTEIGKRWYKLMLENPLKTGEVLTGKQTESINDALESVFDYRNGKRRFWAEGYTEGHVGNEFFRGSVWREVADNADRNNDPGKFTAFIGYEWTSPGQRQGNLHRVVIFKDGGDKVTEKLPFSALDSYNPEDLWKYLQNYEYETGGEVLAIPHNSNTSNGEMFSLKNFEGKPLSRNYAEIRSRWEPLVEVTQLKGDSETHPILSPADEFSDFETWNSWLGRTYEGVKTESWKKRKASEYARSALKLGLDQQAKLGVNPFKFGLIGSTDSHTSLATAEEDNYWGKNSLHEPTRYRLMDMPGDTRPIMETAASGYAAVWATENTREAIFAAMKRKEVYATTGTRMAVRFFGGWDYEEDDAFKPDLVRIGYSKGVPMGGELTEAPDAKAPRFLIRAVKDPDGANLDRIQVIKGWLSKEGEQHEKIYNVALSDGRKDKGKNTKRVGNTVNVSDASYTNTIGDAELSVVWVDPDFNSDDLAFYYVRVLEIPTPRWTAYDMKYFDFHDVPEEVPMIIQERAYTSPIWYSPHAQTRGQ